MVLGLAAVALLLSYLHGYVPPSEESNPLRTLLRPELPVYAAVELGNPFGQLFRALHIAHFGYWDGGFGVLGLALFGAAVLIQLRRGRSIDPAELVFLGSAALMVGVAFLTALGRLKFGLPQALSSRYATPMLLFWLSLALLAIIEIRRRHAGLRLLATGISVLGLVALAYAQSSFVKAGLAWALPRQEGAAALLSGVDDNGALLRIYPAPSRAIELAAQLRARRLAIFAAGWSRWLGTPLADHIRLAVARPMPGRHRPGHAASGSRPRAVSGRRLGLGPGAPVGARPNHHRRWRRAGRRLRFLGLSAVGAGP